MAIERVTEGGEIPQEDIAPVKVEPYTDDTAAQSQLVAEAAASTREIVAANDGQPLEEVVVLPGHVIDTPATPFTPTPGPEAVQGHESPEEEPKQEELAPAEQQPVTVHEDEAHEAPSMEGGEPPIDSDLPPTGGNGEGDEGGEEYDDESDEDTDEVSGADYTKAALWVMQQREGADADEGTPNPLGYLGGEEGESAEEEYAEDPYLFPAKPVARDELPSEALQKLEESEQAIPEEDTGMFGEPTITVPGGELIYSIETEEELQPEVTGEANEVVELSEASAPSGSSETPAASTVKTARIEDFSVDEELQGHGIGTRLMEDLVDRCIEDGVSYITCLAMSEAMISTQIKVMGEEATEFLDSQAAVDRNDGWEGDPSAIPLTVEQAKGSVARAREAKLDSPTPQHVDTGIKMRSSVAVYLAKPPETPGSAPPSAK